MDENLSWRLTRALRPLFPSVEHVGRSVGFTTADTQIVAYAQRNGMVIATQDSDFAHRARARGDHPKVIFLRVGNQPWREQVACFERNLDAIDAFLADPLATLLEIE